MPHPARALVSATLLATATAVRAEEAAPPTGAGSPAETARTISPRTLSLLKAATPKYEPALAGAPAATGETPAGAVAENDPAVVRLPNYIVREDQLPNATEVMTRRALAEMAMNKYLGSKDGLDRGFLNRFTLPDLFAKIPVIGRLLPRLGVTNEERALQRYYEDERIRKRNDLLDLGTITTKTGNRPLGEQIKREAMKAHAP